MALKISSLAHLFGVAAWSWFLHPVLMIVMMVSVLCVSYQREFHSKALQILGGV